MTCECSSLHLWAKGHQHVKDQEELHTVGKVNVEHTDGWQVAAPKVLAMSQEANRPSGAGAHSIC